MRKLQIYKEKSIKKNGFFSRNPLINELALFYNCREVSLYSEYIE